MTWQDVAAIAIGAAAFVAYVHYITRVYPDSCADACEREYYEFYEEKTSSAWLPRDHHVELDPGDEQPLKRG